MVNAAGKTPPEAAPAPVMQQQRVMAETRMLTADGSAAAAAPMASNGANIDTTNQNKTYEYLNYYNRVVGRADAVGKALPTDVSVALGDGSAAFGADAHAMAKASVALGNQSYVTENSTDSVALGAGSVAKEANVISVGSDGTQSFTSLDANRNKITVTPQVNTRRIVNMAAGQNDNDAVNVAQLKGVTTAIGGGAGVGADGTVKGPSYKIGDGTYDNVGDALQAVADVAGQNAGSPLAVKYTDASKTAVALEGQGGTRVSNVKAAIGDTDAVNLKQLKDAGIAVDPTTGTVTNSFVAYDGADKSKVTLGGANGTTLSNVNAGVAAKDAVNVGQLQSAGIIDNSGNVQKAVLFNADGTTANANGKQLANLAAGSRDTDAVNLKQLKDAGIAVDPNTGTVTNSFVAYDGADKSKVTLGGANGTTLSNVNAGVAAKDAVNVGQLQSAGIIDDTGNVQKAVLFNGPGGEANVANTRIINVSKGTAGTDAVNVDQLKGVAGALGGGAGVGSDGSVNGPSYEINGDTYNNVGDALKAAAAAGGTGSELAVKYSDSGKGNVALEGTGGSTISNVKAAAADDQAVNLKQLKDAGLTVDPTTGAPTNAFVAYDGADKSKVTLGGANGTTISNVNAGVAAKDAVNVGQLQSAGIIDNSGNVQKAVLFNADGTTANANADGKQLANLAAGSRDTDAVNLKQLKDAGIAVDPNTGTVTNSFVAYDGTDKTKVTFAGTGGTTLSNVKAGAADMDAVNVKQLKDAGLVDNSGNVQKAVLFNGPNGEANTAGQKIVNVAAGTAATDAVNVGQLQSAGLVGPNGGILRGITYVAGSVEAGTPRVVLEPGTGNSRYFVDPEDASKGMLPAGTRIQNVADAIADTDAVNRGQLADEVAKIGAQGGGRVLGLASAEERTALLNAPPMARAEEPAGSGVTSKTSNFYDAVNDYQRVFGRGDRAGTTMTSDAARVGAAAMVTGGIAMGSNAFVDGARGIGIGQQAYVTLQASDGVALGTGSVANQANTVSVGSDGTSSYTALDENRKPVVIQNAVNTRRIVNMAAGTGDTDAVNVGQLKQVTKAIGGGAVVNADGSVKAPTYTVGGGTYDNVGDALSAVSAQATTGNVLGLAYDDDTKAKVSLQGKDGGTVLANVKAGTADTDAVNVSQLKASGLVDANGAAVAAVTYDDASKTAVTLGGKDAAGPVRLGNVADAQTDNDAVNLKQLKTAGLVDSNGSALDAVVYDSGSAKAQVTFAGANGTVLANVADGRVAIGSREAVNGGQLASLRDSLKSAVDGLDGRVTTLESAPPVSASGGSDPLVQVRGPGADANAGARDSGSVAVGADTTVQASGSVAIGSGAQVQPQATNSVALGKGAVADRANSVSVGAPGSERVVANVADGVRDTDAVNTRQMNQAVKSANGYTDSRINDVWNTVRSDMDDMNRQVNRGIAAASALVNVTPYLPGRTAINAGVASYRGETALGVGVSRWSDNGRFNINAGVSAARQDEPIYRVGVGYVF